jgi:hypothetical protein
MAALLLPFLWGNNQKSKKNLGRTSPAFPTLYAQSPESGINEFDKRTARIL